MRANSYFVRLSASAPAIEIELVDASATLAAGSSGWLLPVVSAAQQAEPNTATSSAVNATLIRLMPARPPDDGPDGSWRNTPGAVRQINSAISRTGRFR